MTEKLKSITKQNKPYFIWAVGLSIVGCFLLITSLFLPTRGVIDPTVISASGTLFVFSGSIVGIRGSFDNKLVKFEAEIEQRMRKRKEDDENDGKSENGEEV